MPLYINPAEYLLDMTSSDFTGSDREVQEKMAKLYSEWEASDEASRIRAVIPEEAKETGTYAVTGSDSRGKVSILQILAALLHRSFIKSYRDVVAYGIRFAMYIGLAIMIGTVWLRLPPTQSSIQPFTNAIVSR